MVEDIVFNPQKAMKLKQQQLSDLNAGFGAPDSNLRAAGGLIDRLTSGGGAGDGVGALEGDVKTITMDVPDQMVGLIIGKGGETIRDLQASSKAHIQVNYSPIVPS